MGNRHTKFSNPEFSELRGILEKLFISLLPRKIAFDNDFGLSESFLRHAKDSFTVNILRVVELVTIVLEQTLSPTT